jgi:multidrug efflux pump subunit AcrA (membrane-fusion protein)
VAGVVIERLVEKGQSVAAAQTVIRVLDPSSLWIRSYIDERISGAISVGQTALITLRSRPNSPLKGGVKRIDFQSDKLTQEHVVYVGFSEPLNEYYLNEQAEVSILTKTLSSVKLLPISTLVTHQKTSGVWVDRDSKAYFVPLDILSIDDNAFAFKKTASLDGAVLVMQKGKKPLSDGVSINP